VRGGGSNLSNQWRNDFVKGEKKRGRNPEWRVRKTTIFYGGQQQQKGGGRKNRGKKKNKKNLSLEAVRVRVLPRKKDNHVRARERKGGNFS